MTQQLNIAPTAEAIRDMAGRLRQAAYKLERDADRLEEKEEWEAISDSVSTVTSLIPNLRLDLLVARPIREYRMHLASLNASGKGK